MDTWFDSDSGRWLVAFSGRRNLEHVVVFGIAPTRTTPPFRLVSLHELIPQESGWLCSPLDMAWDVLVEIGAPTETKGR
jgi:hypothetical protein